ncbi:MAG: YicC family protein [Deltaproteobacteria bacterium]|nr:YicC family protein [Deltaproteobacteria bacterium]
MSVSSMTGYGFEITKDGYMTEIRSLNGRYLDITVKIPQELYPYENKFRNTIKVYFSRGNIELTISHKNIERNVLIPRLNRHYAKYYVDILNELSKLGSGSVDYSALIQVRDIVYTDIDEKAVQEAVKNLIVSISNVCCIVKEMRKKEGSVLQGVLEENIRILRDLIRETENYAVRQSEIIKQNLLSKVAEILNQAKDSQERFEEEVLYFVNRMDISEEIDRLTSHIEQFELLLKNGGQIGRRLDFLCQEILRELNTMGSKSTMIEIKRLVISGKDTVERLREQVQNIE